MCIMIYLQGMNCNLCMVPFIEGKNMKRWPSWYTISLVSTYLVKHNIMLLVNAVHYKHIFLNGNFYEYMLPNDILSLLSCFSSSYIVPLCSLSPLISYSFSYSTSTHFLKRLSTHIRGLNHSKTNIVGM